MTSKHLTASDIRH